jgi:hypothetical protein
MTVDTKELQQKIDAIIEGWDSLIALMQADLERIKKGTGEQHESSDSKAA